MYDAFRTGVLAEMRYRPFDAPVADPSVAAELLLLRKEVSEMKSEMKRAAERMDGELTLMKYVVSKLLVKTEAFQKADDEMREVQNKTRALEDTN